MCHDRHEFERDVLSNRFRGDGREIRFADGMDDLRYEGLLRVHSSRLPP
jgi:hypothetical protein